jgi:hypothetical protein
MVWGLLLTAGALFFALASLTLESVPLRGSVWLGLKLLAIRLKPHATA